MPWCRNTWMAKCIRKASIWFTATPRCTSDFKIFKDADVIYTSLHSFLNTSKLRKWQNNPKQPKWANMGQNFQNITTDNWQELRSATATSEVHAIDNAFRGQLDALRDAVLQEMQHDFDEFVRSHDSKFTATGIDTESYRIMKLVRLKRSWRREQHVEMFFFDFFWLLYTTFWQLASFGCLGPLVCTRMSRSRATSAFHWWAQWDGSMLQWTAYGDLLCIWCWSRISDRDGNTW